MSTNINDNTEKTEINNRVTNFRLEFPPAQCFQDRHWIHKDPEQENVVTKDE